MYRYLSYHPSLRYCNEKLRNTHTNTYARLTSLTHTRQGGVPGFWLCVLGGFVSRRSPQYNISPIERSVALLGKGRGAGEGGMTSGLPIVTIVYYRRVTGEPKPSTLRPWPCLGCSWWVGGCMYLYCSTVRSQTVCQCCLCVCMVGNHQTCRPADHTTTHPIHPSIHVVGRSPSTLRVAKSPPDPKIDSCAIHISTSPDVTILVHVVV